MNDVTMLAPAKINLTLSVTGRRDDGYHEIASVFQKLELADQLTFSPTTTGAIRLTCDDPALPTDENNLVVKAALQLQKLTKQPWGADIHLNKKIPVAAGLGGGSSDCAATLMALNHLWNFGLSHEELSDIGLRLGADVPFFLQPAPAAFVTGIGENFAPLEPQTTMHLLLVKPDFGISAANAYQKSTFSFGPVKNRDKIIAAATSGRPELLTSVCVNDLQPWAFEKHPRLKELFDKIVATDATVVMMSGSGPTLFALYETTDLLKRGANSLAGAAPVMITTKTIITNSD